VHATLVAGARDDLVQEHYDHADARKVEMIMTTLGFGSGTLDWARTPDLQCSTAAEALALLVAAAASRTSLPLIAIEHDSGVAGLAVVRVVAPDLTEPSRRDPLITLPSSTPPAAARSRRPVVFIGPTLEGATVPPGVEVLPPATCGDLTRLLRDPPAAVALVDGYFATSPSVWHKEIIALLANGIPVIGAGSLGALRAAELATYGMFGVGQVFDAYLNGSVCRDDAVMLVHAPAELGWRALTIALVDAEDALCATQMPPADRRMLQRIVRTTPFARRTWHECLSQFAARTGRAVPNDVERSLRQRRSLKHEDAMMMVQRLDRGQWSPPNAIAPPELTGSYVELVAKVMSAP